MQVHPLDIGSPISQIQHGGTQLQNSPGCSGYELPSSASDCRCMVARPQGEMPGSEQEQADG